METFKEKSPRIVEAIQIADNVTDIMSLPCVQSVEKQMDVDYPYLYHLTNNVVAKKRRLAGIHGLRLWLENDAGCALSKAICP